MPPAARKAEPRGEDWRPTATLEALRRRAALLAEIRAFFAERGVLEVDTPALCSRGVTDLHLHNLSCRVELPFEESDGGDGRGRTFYLQTSPEFAMKRLLAAGSGPIFQICKAFRDGEAGRLHQPEFTMLEWYRPGFDHHALMDEMDALLAAVLGAASAERVPYGELFEQKLGIDPHRAAPADLRVAAERAGVDAVGMDDADRDTWLHLLLSCVIEPELGRGRPTFVHDFPASQAALAKVRRGAAGLPDVAERFEVYIEGIELANGYHELTAAAEQRRRFESDLAARRAAGLPEPPVDERLLAALEADMPPCAGVALGVDRLLMVVLGAGRIDEIVAFPASRA